MNRSKIFSLVICLLFCSGSSTSSSVVVSRRVHSNLSPDRDVFSNPTCKSSDCISDSTCFAGDCCTCQCSYGKPNFLVKNYECKSNVETKQIINAGCAFSIRPDNEPLEVLLLTEEDSGKVKFTSSTVRVNCSNDDIVNQWHYLNAHDQWVRAPGEGNVFFVFHQTVGGHSQDKKDLSFLQWNAKLDSKYGGLLIKVSLHCKETRPIGCLLAKINGTFTFDRTSPPLPTSEPPTTTPLNSIAQTSTQTPTPEPLQKSTAAETTTAEPAAAEPTPYVEPAGSNLPKTTREPSQKPTTNINLKTPNKQVAVTNQTSEQSSAPYGLYIILAGCIGLICLGCLVFVAYRKRKSWLTWMAKKKGQPAVAEKTYEDPIYAELPENGPDFDNPVYCDPAGQYLNRRNRQDPLPQIPGTESSYQQLSDLTRTNAPEPATPALPPSNSSPMATDNEAYDYDNPPPIDNPPANESADYDNPPQIDNPRANESSDDNPPLTTNNDITINETSDYDNPQQTASPVDYTPPTVDFVPGTSSSTNNQDESGPEYYILEPDETHM